MLQVRKKTGDSGDKRVEANTCQVMVAGESLAGQGKCEPFPVREGGREDAPDAFPKGFAVDFDILRS